MANGGYIAWLAQRGVYDLESGREIAAREGRRGGRGGGVSRGGVEQGGRRGGA